MVAINFGPGFGLAIKKGLFGFSKVFPVQSFPNLVYNAKCLEIKTLTFLYNNIYK